MTAARKVHVTARAEFPLGPFDVEVLRAEGAVQLIYRGRGWDRATARPLANQFASAETAAQLRAMADHLDGLDWPKSGVL